MKKRRLIPFSWRNIILGLRGKTKEKAEAEYYYEGKELEAKLIEIDYRENKIEKELKLLELDNKYGEFSSEYEFNKKYIELKWTLENKNKKKKDRDQVSLDLALLENEFEFDKMTELEYEKSKATLLKEPWVHAELIPNKMNPMRGHFELDWNEYFIKMLEEKGYTGSTDEMLIEQWLKALHANQLYEPGVNDPNQTEDLVTRNPIDDSRAEYS